MAVDGDRFIDGRLLPSPDWACFYLRILWQDDANEIHVTLSISQRPLSSYYIIHISSRTTVKRAGIAVIDDAIEIPITMLSM